MHKNDEIHSIEETENDMNVKNHEFYLPKDQSKFWVETAGMQHLKLFLCSNYMKEVWGAGTSSLDSFQSGIWPGYETVLVTLTDNIQRHLDRG